MSTARTLVLGLTLALVTASGCSRDKSGEPAATPTGAPAAGGPAANASEPVTVTVETS